MTASSCSNARSDGWQALLGWLDPVPSLAAKRYLTARARLIRLHRRRGAADPEWIVDEAFSRTAMRLGDGLPRRGDAIAYVTAVARLVALEDVRRRARMHRLTGEPAAAARELPDDRRDALEACLDALPEVDRQLLLAYHAGRGVERIARRAQLAARMGLQLGALRTRAHRLRLSLAARLRDQAAAAARTRSASQV